MILLPFFFSISVFIASMIELSSTLYSLITFIEYLPCVYLSFTLEKSTFLFSL